MNSDQYNQAILNFYSNSFLQISLQEKIKSEVHKIAKELTDEFSTSFNSYLAKDFLDNLELHNKNIEDKLKNYPELFWLTPTGKNYFEAMQNDITSIMTTAVLSALNNNEKLDYNMLTPTVTNLITLYKQDLKSGKKQLLKLKKEITSHKILNSHSQLISLLVECVSRHKSEKIICDIIKWDFELLL